VFVVFYVSLGRSPYRRAFLDECTGVYYARCDVAGLLLIDG